ncbi:hypothetical protein [Oscillibacter sp.]|uniref:hypothetical protein n=1 Tax=Oscillibacter sp. TaxID=1945593 RepID=UPI00289C5305|nr:hypothetical protein [Oscillibacter sp.]
MSMQDFEQKRQFVQRELSRCIAASHEGVERLEYEYHDSGDECVTIRFSNGYHKSVNTTGDSLHSILLDVLRALAEV